jgi:uncharacterized protein YbjQ (UPF0145 family)
MDEREAAAEAERSRAQIEAGGLPVAAERRLRELANSPGGLFTSDLSVNEFALLRRLGITPLTQVMGSSIFQHGWQNLPYDNWYGYRSNSSAYGLFSGGGGRRNWGSSGDGRAWTRELTNLSAAFNGARERALDRLLAEARLAGADAVVGVRVQQGAHAFLERDTVEFTAVGTAVRVPAPLRTGRVVITDLSAQEYVQLAAEGYRPVGVVGTTVVMYTASSYSQSIVLGSGNNFFSVAGRANQELPDFTQGFYEARETAVLHLSRQAQTLGADGVIGVQFAEHIGEREYDDANENKHHDLIVTIHVLGTAITEGHPRVARPPITTILPLRRLKEPHAG